MRNLAVALAFVALAAASATAAPTPVPGGANQVKALSGKVGDTIFNGVLRIQISELRDATADDHPEKMYPNPGQKIMVMSVLLRNGAHSDFIDLLSYTLADKDDVTFDIGSSYIQHANLHILQGGSARQTAMFPVDQSFVPTKLIVQCATCGAHSAFRSVRFTVGSPQ
ncbi:MAG: hypothetical protein ACR2KS_00760 [Candidatus Eremiobacter antarcticus]|nr:hypothetical protein [Candidatus Eremiobacteraeota bacterium]